MSHKTLIWLLCLLVTAVAMEGWAALLHRCVWHALLWPVHRSHHRGPGDVAARITKRGAQPGRWEANDMLSVTHAPVAVAAILYGCVGPSGLWREVVYGVGLGMSVFGVAYILVHDGLAHSRLPVRRLLRWPYLRRVRALHLLHHRTGGAPFGLFSAPAMLLPRRRRPSARPGRRGPTDTPSG